MASLMNKDGIQVAPPVSPPSPDNKGAIVASVAKYLFDCGWTYEQIAVEFNRSQSWVKVTLQRARRDQ